MTQYYMNRKKHVYICGKIPKGNRVQTISLQFFHMFDSCFIAFYDYICMEMCILVTFLLLPYYLYSYCVVLYFIYAHLGPFPIHTFYIRQTTQHKLHSTHMLCCRQLNEGAKSKRQQQGVRVFQNSMPFFSVFSS